MDERFNDVKAVGFDLDQTLYVDLPEIKQTVRGEIYRLIAETNKIGFEDAKARFEEAYTRHNSGGSALRECGVQDAREALRDCLDRADVSKILKTDDKLVGMFDRMRGRYQLFIMTDSRTENAYRKLRALGIDPGIFNPGIYWDADPQRPGFVKKDDGTAFRYAQQVLGIAPSGLAYVGNSEKDDILHPAALGWKTVHLAEKPSSHATAGIKAIHDLEGLLL